MDFEPGLWLELSAPASKQRRNHAVLFFIGFQSASGWRAHARRDVTITP
jgi:hypothetical protein